MAGDGLRRPLNAPSGQPPAYGTQPGASSPVIVATKVIIIGPAGELLVYNPSAGLGNLIASITGTAKTDAGNSVLAGITGYSKIGGTFYATELGGGSDSIVFWSAATEAGPWTQQGLILVTAAEMELSSAGGMVLAPGTATPVLFLPSGLSGTLPAFQLDRTAHTAGNTVTATDLTAAWDIPAGDGSTGAKYTLRCLVKATTGATAAETLTIGADLNGGTLVPLATLGAAFNGGALGVTYAVPVELTVVPGAGNSASDAEIVLAGPLGDTSANRLATNGANMAGYSDATVFNPAADNTVALYAQWGGTGGTGQLAAVSWSSFTREGN